MAGGSSGLYSGDIDPEIAELLGTSSNQTGPSRSSPKFDDLFSETGSGSQDKKDSRSPSAVAAATAAAAADMSKKAFAPINQFFEEEKPFFQDPGYYKSIISMDSEASKRMHRMLSEFLNAKDAETRSAARLRFIPAYWDFLSEVVVQLGPKLPQPLLLLLRFGALLPSIISEDQRKILGQVIMENRTGEPVHYFDEWLRKVATGEVTPLATDEEVKVNKKGTDTSAISQKLEKSQGILTAQVNLIMTRCSEIQAMENIISQYALTLGKHDRHRKFTDLAMSYNSTQRQALFNIQETVKKLNDMDKAMDILYRDLDKLQTEVESLESKLQEAGGGSSSVDSKIALGELNSLRQVHKLTCGRQGNHFPILIKNYMPPSAREIGIREQVIQIMSEVERLDPGLFHRSFKGTVNRIVPHVILMPSYGDFGVCWEPFEKFNRSTSRGRIAIPMYSKNLKLAVISGLADLRWQVAKEKAGYHWMDPSEGITGLYYTYFDSRKMRGDIKQFFVNDYTLWITKEAEGTQKLDKEVRGIFWRNLSFPPEVRDMLKNRGFVYSELYRKDINRSMSDGY